MSATHSKCSDQSDGRSFADGKGGGGGFMLFGVRLMMEQEGSAFRKSASMTNLAHYDHQPQDSNNDVVAAAGYASDDVVHPSGRSRERKRGVPWSEEEHRLFLLGLQRVGKGDWRGISRNYVKTRTPTQVASHAQKYFLRRNNHSRRRRRSSLFDITTDAVVTSSAKEDQMHQENPPPQPPIVPRQNLSRNPVPTIPVAVTPLSVPVPSENPMEEDLALGQLNQLTNSPRPIRPIPILPIPPPPSSKMANLKINSATNLEQPSLSLNLSVSSLSQSPLPSEELPSSNEHSPRGHHPPPFQAMPASFSGSGGDSIISVA